MKRIKAADGSLTVEAGLAFPVFMFAILALSLMFRYLATEYAVEKGLLSVARTLSPYTEIVETACEKRGSMLDGLLGAASDKELLSGDLTAAGIAGDLTDSLIIGNLLGRYLQQYPFALNSIKGGPDGLNCYGSVLYSEKETVVLKCSYRLKTPISMFSRGSIPVSQELEYRYFSGLAVSSLLEGADQENETDDRMVYITEEKKVYHQSLDCPALRLVIRSCPLNDIGSERNAGGAKYYKCERCARGKKPDIVFISKDGDRYHYDKNCGGLKRTITRIPLSEACLTRRPCKRCMNKAEDQ